ncbi:MAG: preprotein translocase subunit SecG [Magnetococcales bacterium]|nr:preprotein translocase subunit SecG [Magnetococcales bacterium]MBF0439128.1 preprotein translocase subunit SecG [Magnetococcales bacterium]
MTLILTVLHVLVCLSLVFVVLLQKGSGADMGAAFGGSSQSLFGARGSGDFLSKLTAGLATVFMITSLTLAFFSTRPGDGKSVMDSAPISSSTSGKGAAPAKAQESGPPVPSKSVPAKQEEATEAPQAKPVPPPPAPTPEAKP